MSEKKSKLKTVFGAIATVVVGLACLLYVLMGGTLPSDGGEDKADPAGLVIRFLDVGQGDGILISCGGENMLIDAGIRDVKDYVINSVKAVGKLKIAVATHPHSDHIGAMAEVIRDCPPEIFIMPDKEHTSASFRKMVEAAEAVGADMQIGYEGLKYTLGEADITILSPEKDKYYESVNDYSIVILLEYKGFRALFTGDAEAETESVFAQMTGGKVDLFKAGHHGGSSSNTEALMSVITPSVAVVTCGYENDYGHPHRETVEIFQKYGVKTYRTDLNGAVTVTVDSGGNYYVETEK